jgi:hypothetical protein
LMPIIARGPIPRTLAAVFVTSHDGQWSRVSFNVGGEEGHFFFNSLKLEMGKEIGTSHPIVYTIDKAEATARNPHPG